MEEKTWYDVFIGLLHEKFPKNAQLTQEMMKLLYLEREAAYRRLRKDVSFTAAEIVKLATTWNISLDEIIGVHSGQVPFQMLPFNHLNPSPKEFGFMQKSIRALDHIRSTPHSEYMEVSNRIPRPFGIGFDTLYRFEIFNWVYQYNNIEESQKLFSKVVIPNAMNIEFEHYKKNIVHVKNSNFILDELTFDYLVQNIKYFHEILVITNEETELIKNELHVLLDYMLEIANKGCYPETFNKVNMFISQLNIDTNYSYYYTDQLKTCRIHAFGRYDITSHDADMVENFRNWMNLKKRSAIQISEVNEKKRIEFFTKQRKIVDSL
jgi:hypothetical protein